MGNQAGEDAARDRAEKWNAMLDALAEYQSGEVSAEEALNAATEYVVSIHNVRINVRNE